MSSYALPAIPRRGEWKQHPVSYVGSLLTLVITLLLAISFTPTLFNLGVTLFTASARSKATAGGWVVIGFVWLIALIIIGSAFSSIKSGLFTVWWMDNEKINEVYSLVKRQEGSQSYARIDEVAISQGVLGRIFGYGTVTITARGKDNRWIIPNAPQARELHEFFSAVASRNKIRFERNGE